MTDMTPEQIIGQVITALRNTSSFAIIDASLWVKALTAAGYRIVDQGLTPLEEHLLAMLASEYDQQRDGGFDRDVEQLFLNEGLSLNAYRAMTTDTGS